MKTYLLRDIEDEDWDRAKIAAVRRKESLRDALIRFVKEYGKKYGK